MSLPLQLQRSLRPNGLGRLVSPTAPQLSPLAVSRSTFHARQLSSTQFRSDASPAAKKESPAPQQPSATPAPERRQNILDRMGATRNVKIVVIGALCIYGTLETIFYVKAGMRYFFPPQPVDVEKEAPAST